MTLIVTIVSYVKYLCLYESRVKSSYDDVISAVDNFFDLWDPSTATLMEDMWGL